MQKSDTFLDLRKADEAECLAAGLSSQQALMAGTEGTYAYAVDVNGEPLAFWGYGSVNLFDDTAYTWLLTRPGVEAHAFRFARISQRIIEHMHENYEHLMCLVHYEYALSIKWLRWLGFLPAQVEAPAGFIWMRRSR
jgi:hypothetical protein